MNEGKEIKKEQKAFGLKTFYFFNKTNHINLNSTLNNNKIYNMCNKSLNQLDDDNIFCENKSSKNILHASNKPFNTAYSSFFKKQIPISAISQDERIDRINGTSKSIKNQSLIKFPKDNSKVPKLSSFKSNKIKKNIYIKLN